MKFRHFNHVILIFLAAMLMGSTSKANPQYEAYIPKEPIAPGALTGIAFSACKRLTGSTTVKKPDAMGTLTKLINGRFVDASKEYEDLLRDSWIEITLQRSKDKNNPTYVALFTLICLVGDVSEDLKDNERQEFESFSVQDVFDSKTGRVHIRIPELGHDDPLYVRNLYYSAGIERYKELIFSFTPQPKESWLHRLSYDPLDLLHPQTRLQAKVWSVKKGMEKPPPHQHAALRFQLHKFWTEKREEVP